MPPRKLKEIDVEEISLVRSAANRRKFIILKKEFIKMDWIEILKSFLGEEDEQFQLSEEDIAKAKEIPESALKAITGALNILNKYKDVFPPDVLTAIKTLTKYAAYAYPEKKSAEISDEQFLEELEKAGARLSKATIEQLKKIKEIVDGLIGEKEKTQKTKYGDLPPQVQKIIEEYEALKAEKEERLKKEKEEKEKEAMKKAIKEEILEDLKKAIGKKARVRKSIEGQDDDEDIKDKDKGPKWPSLTSQEE